jgi:hypothetical protein
MAAKNTLKEDVKKIKDNKLQQKEWYKRWWGIIIAILFWPYFLVWYAWAKSKWNKATKIAITVVIAVFMLPILGAVVSGPTTQNNNTASQNKEQKVVTEPEQKTKVEPKPATEPPKPTESVSQKNAVRSAKNYLNTAAFSYQGLVEQLEFEKFSPEDAKYGADKSGANWNEQAAKKAKGYMSFSAFSRGSLIAQLEFDKFTPEQAAFGADSVGL